MDVLLSLLKLLTNWYIAVPIAGIFIYFALKNYRQVAVISNTESILLALDIPKTNDKSEFAAEQMFASLHGILRNDSELKANQGIQEHLSFEIASVGGQIRFYVWVPKSLQNFVESQIYAQYPTVQIHVAEEDYVIHERNHSIICTSEINLIDSEFLPLKTFQNFEVDPLAGITGTLAKLESTGEELWIQVLARPIPDDWHKASDKWVNSIKNGDGLSILSGGGVNLSWFLQILSALWQPPESTAGSGAKAAIELSERDKTRIAEASKKATKLGYQTKIRLAYLGDSQVSAKLQIQALVGTFKQYNSTNLNGFTLGNMSYLKEDLQKYRARLFDNRGFILNIEEIASLWHLPHTNVETPNIVWASTKTAEPPSKLPVITGNDTIDENISAFGLTNFRGINHQFGMYRSDRSRHVYIIGQTGTGKSALLELFTISDIFHNQGYAIIDPHGDFAIDNLRFIPESRVEDVVYFNPADTNYPLGFNPLEINNPSQKSTTTSEMIGVLKRMFGEVSWGPRLEYILRYTLLALLERPETTLLDITRMLTDKKFREETLGYCKDTVVLQFWRVEFASWNDKFAAEAVAPVLNKVGAFTANPIIRNIIGQPKSTFNIRDIMDSGKILIVNLSKGLLGEDNSDILGSLLVTKIQLAAMSRSDIPDLSDRRPFYLYVDEFQNFATDSFATILSEARKYGLNLTVANQYISQMSDTVRDAVFGNVGTTISFRVSADDAPMLAKQFEPQFESSDLLQMHNRHFVLSMVINGEKVPAFSATTLTLPSSQINHIESITENTRRHYGRSRTDVEKEIEDRIKSTSNQKTNPRQPQPKIEGEPRSLVTEAILAATKQPGEKHLVTKVPESANKDEPAPAPKRKRTRTRHKRKPVESAPPSPSDNKQPAPTTTVNPATPPSDPTELRLR